LKKLSIIFEDSDILVIDKPAGLVVNRSESQTETLADLVASYLSLPRVEGLGERLEGLKQPSAFLERSGIVHRIDKETSGIVLAAKNEKSFEKLQAQFAKRKIEKEYLCLVHGWVRDDKGIITEPIGRLESGKFGAVQGGREAVTEYEVTENLKLKTEKFQKLLSAFGKKLRAFYEKEARDYSYLRVFPKTGRTHQIRVHLKSVGYPVVSDPLYLGRRFAKFDLKFCPRLFLHATRIKFVHPKSRKPMEFSSPLPFDLQKVLNQLE
jgi:23S rRNA pseudouridine1911/1915/1917 synthase